VENMKAIIIGITIAILIILVGLYINIQPQILDIYNQNETIIGNQTKIMDRINELHPYQKSRQEIKQKMHNITM